MFYKKNQDSELHGGDLWQYNIRGEQGINRIDRDTIQMFHRSEISDSIAYSLIVLEKEEVGLGDQKEVVDVHRRQLMLANSKGSYSHQIATSVDDWGWIPNTNLLWYETATVQSYFSWDYRGDGTIWIYDPATDASQKLLSIGENIQLLSKWSPNGSHFMFIKNNKLSVIDRETLQQKQLISLPYVGGDRGGPQPIPAFYWSADAQTIYTTFTPKIFDDNPNIADIVLTDLHAYGMAIPIDGSAPKQLFQPISSSLLNDENTPKGMFSDDFTKVLFPRVNDVGKVTQSDLILYDITEEKEYTVQNNYQSVSQYGYPEQDVQATNAWISGDMVYYTLVEDVSPDYEHQYRMNLVATNYKTQEYTQFSTGLMKDYPQVVHFSEEDMALWFTTSGSLLFLNEQGTFPVITENVISAAFYPEKEPRTSELIYQQIPTRGNTEYRHTGIRYGFSILIPNGMMLETSEPQGTDKEKHLYSGTIKSKGPIDFYNNLFNIRMRVAKAPAREALSATKWEWDATAIDPVASITVDGVKGYQYHTRDGEGGVFPVTTVVLEQGEYTYLLIFTTNDFEDPRINRFLRDFKFLYKVVE